MKKFQTICVLFLLFLFVSPNIFAQPKLWGTLPHAGEPGAGLVYEFNLNGEQFSDIYEFEKYEGDNPQFRLLLADNGLFYGIANGGFGQFGSLIYTYDPISNEFKIVHDFYDPNTMHSYRANDGCLMQASDGLIYGFNQNGGVTGDGQFFLLKPDNNELQYLADFDALSIGKYPVGGLTEASDGKLYGVTNEGGFFDYGTLFSYDPENDQLAMERSFEWADGVSPQNSLVLASNGILYGLTYAGGVFGDGVIYSYEPGTGIYELLHEFGTTAHGGKPYGRLFQASDGKLYGTASAGGLNGDGILFSYDINLSDFSVLIDFSGTNGAYPNGSVIEHEGYLYGMTTRGGVANEGLLFSYNYQTNDISKLADFYGEDYGKHPYGSLAMGLDGKLYGQTYLGGEYNRGIMFDFNTSTNTFTKRFDFGEANEGSLNYGSLLLGSDGWVYGTTSEGGQYQYGTIYRINPDNREFESLYEFDMFTYGGTPLSGLMQASDGYFYGTTPYGGTVNGGVIYRFHENSNLVSVLEEMNTPSQGQNPSGTPVQAADGLLYGLTSNGGSIGDGAMYKYNLSNNVYLKVADFQDAASGSHPLGSPVEATNGKLYALAEQGGQFTHGTLFEYDIANAFLSVIVHFDGLNKGAMPAGTLLQYDDNILYGLCSRGGVYDEGTLFVFDAETGVCTKLYDFNPTAGGHRPGCTLMKSSNNKIYGNTSQGGAYDFGVLFEYDPATDDYVVLHEFTSFRESPWFSAMIEVDTDFGLSENEKTELAFSVFPNPASDQLTIFCEDPSNEVQISIVDVRGKLIQEESFSSLTSSPFTATFDVGELESGIYFVHLSSGENISTQKIVVR